MLKYCLLCMMFFICLDSAHANCTSIGNVSDSSAMKNITVPRDAAIGSVIQTFNTPVENGNWASGCDGNEGLSYALTYSNKKSNYGSHVYETDVPGIGIRVVNASDASMSFDTPASEYVYNATGFGWYGAKVELIIIGKVSSGILHSGSMATMSIHNRSGYYQVGYTMNVTGSTVTSLACAVTSGDSLAFPIGNVTAEQFISPGTVSQEFSTANLGLSCDPDVNINVTLSGVQNPDSSEPSILSLSNQGQDGVAQGIGVQLFYDGKPLELNKLLNLRKSSGAQETLPITARYIQTKEKIQAGSANATATLNLTYQ
jgi:type 1 fimbria pilin